MPRSLTLKIYSDPGHGWVRVPLQLLQDLKIAEDISSFSYRRNGHAYLEEDGDLGLLLAAAKAAGIVVKLRSFHTNKESKIRGYRSYRTDTQAAAYEAALKARIRAQGCSADFVNNQLIIKVIA
jgi:hypothetical protein